MIARPAYRPTRYVGPVSVWVRLHEQTGDPESAEAWIGDICVAGYDLDRVSVEHPDDRTRDVVRDFRADEGDAALEWMIDRVNDWIGADE